MATKFDELLFSFNQLSEAEQAKFINAVKSSGKVVTLDDLLKSKRDDGIRCPYCGSTDVVRYGRRNGTQRYRCQDKGCGKMFSDLTGSILSATKKDFQVWKRYVKCMMDGLSVRKSAAICKINRNTAFVWRHKILDALALLAAKQKRLGGIVEADETFFPLSYKGSRKNFGRKPHKRGGATSRRGISREKVCVSCAIDRNNKSFSKVATLGKVTIQSLHAVLNRRISKRAILCTDKERAYKAFTRRKGIKLVQVESGIAKLGVYHIQHINAYHSRLKHFIKFKGVSTKYLNNYLVWNNAIMETGMTRIGILRQALKAVVFTRWLDLSCRPAVPLPVLT